MRYDKCLHLSSSSNNKLYESYNFKYSGNDRFLEPLLIYLKPLNYFKLAKNNDSESLL